MNDWPFEDPGSLNQYYGNPDANSDGLPDAEWEKENIMRVIPAYPMVLAWDTTIKLKTISIHKKCAASLAVILKQIATHISASEIDKYQLNRFGGAYMFRMKRGSPKLSVHSWGAAIDLSPALNPLGRPWDERRLMIPRKVIQMFNDEGWSSGVEWKRPDCMHMEATRGN